MIRECLLSCSGGVSVSANQCKCTLQLGCYLALSNNPDRSLSALSASSVTAALLGSLPTNPSRAQQIVDVLGR